MDLKSYLPEVTKVAQNKNLRSVSIFNLNVGMNQKKGVQTFVPLLITSVPIVAFFECLLALNWMFDRKSLKKKKDRKSI